VSERSSIPCSSVVHRCLLIVVARSSASAPSIGDCGHDGSLRFCGRVCSSTSVSVVVWRGRFTRASGSSSSTSSGEGDSERSDIEGDLRFRVEGLNQGCSCAGCTQEQDSMRPGAPTGDRACTCRCSTWLFMLAGCTGPRPTFAKVRNGSCRSSVLHTQHSKEKK
jgi:hypothetical protein